MYVLMAEMVKINCCFMEKSWLKILVPMFYGKK